MTSVPAASSTLATSTTRTSTGSAAGSTSVDAKFKARGKKYFGVATDQGRLTSGSDVVIQQRFGQVTPENSMKWESIQRTFIICPMRRFSDPASVSANQSLTASRGVFNWAQADYLVNWAVTNNKIIRGHTLVWHSQLPNWVAQITSRTELTQVIEAHIAAVVGRYKGKIAQWVSG